MNIHDLPEEILVKILVEGNFLSISNVCQTWRDHAVRNKSRFDVIFFDLTKDNPEKIEKNPNIMIVYNSTLNDLGYWEASTIDLSQKYDFEQYAPTKINSYMIKKYSYISKKIIFLNILYFSFNYLRYLKPNKIPIDFFISEFLWELENKVKIVNIKFKDIYNITKSIDQHTFYETEILNMINLLFYQKFCYFEKLTFQGLNNTYFIYDENKKILIIRFGNYEKYNFPMEKIFICRKYNDEHAICTNRYHKQYLTNSFICGKSNWIFVHYPACLIEYNYEKLINKVKKLIVISSEFHDFMFDQLLETAKNRKEKEIEYHSLDSSKTKFEQENFEFVPVEKEKEHEYSFEQIHFKYFGKNIY